jgi:hypothetical protein
MNHTTKIATFVIRPRDEMWNARDTDKSNNWGEYTCPTYAEITAWALWAHHFKTGRTFREFDHAAYRKAVQS